VCVVTACDIILRLSVVTIKTNVAKKHVNEEVFAKREREREKTRTSFKLHLKTNLKIY
jgi:hypothetical protein